MGKFLEKEGMILHFQKKDHEQEVIQQEIDSNKEKEIIKLITETKFIRLIDMIEMAIEENLYKIQEEEMNFQETDKKDKKEDNKTILKKKNEYNMIKEIKFIQMIDMIEMVTKDKFRRLKEDSIHKINMNEEIFQMKEMKEREIIREIDKIEEIIQEIEIIK